jgi:MraZ protein
LAFHGIHDHSLDSKNRLTIPVRFRAELAGGAVLTKGFETCLQLHPQGRYQAMAEQALAGVNPLSAEARDLNRHLFGNTMPTELDSAGRIMLPGPFAAHARIEKDCVVIGSGA